MTILHLWSLLLVSVPFQSPANIHWKQRKEWLASRACSACFDALWQLPFFEVPVWATLCCVLGHLSPRPTDPNTVHGGFPPWEAAGPALKNTLHGDTAVKQNLRPSLSPGCRGWTPGMLPVDKRRLAAWFLHMLTFVRTCALLRNSLHWCGFCNHNGSSLQTPGTKGVGETHEEFWT